MKSDAPQDTTFSILLFVFVSFSLPLSLSQKPTFWMAVKWLSDRLKADHFITFN
jgi:hypothetical protein